MQRFLSVAVASLSAALAAQSSVTITDGNASFSYTSYAPAPSNTGGFANFTVGGTDHLYQSWWCYAVQGDTVGSAFNTSNGQMTVLTSADNRSVTLQWIDVDARGFSALLTNTVYSTGATSAVSAQSLTIVNNGASPLAIQIYKYIDLDVAATTANMATQAPTWPAGNHMIQDSLGTQAWAMADGFSNFEVATYPNVRSRIFSGVGGQPFVPGNIGLPFGTADYTSCFYWVATIPPNSAQTFRAMIAIGHEPASQRIADATTYCVGKAGTNGVPVWVRNAPFIGATVPLRVDNGFTGSAPIVFLGVTQTATPVNPFGTLCTVPVTTFTMPPFDAARTSTLPIPIPNQPSFGGVSLYLQAVFADPGAAASVAHTDGLTWTFGSFAN